MSLLDKFNHRSLSELVPNEILVPLMADPDQNPLNGVSRALALGLNLAADSASSYVSILHPPRYKANNYLFFQMFMEFLAERYDLVRSYHMGERCNSFYDSMTTPWDSLPKIGNEGYTDSEEMVEVEDEDWLEEGVPQAEVNNDDELMSGNTKYFLAGQYEDHDMMLNRIVLVSKQPKPDVCVNIIIDAVINVYVEATDHRVLEDHRRAIAEWIVAQEIPFEVEPTKDTYQISTIYFDHTAGRPITKSYSRDLPGEKDGLLWSYPARQQEKLEALLRYNPHEVDGITGKLILFHGPPGTGKTSYTKLLASSWTKWADFLYVIDPPAFFQNPAYIAGVLSTDSGSKGRYPVYVLEDMDELITSDKTDFSGGAFGKLLNMSDGILGQINPMYFLITTNKPFTSLAPAVVRDGRCLAELEFPKFSESDIKAWQVATGNEVSDDVWRMAREDGVPLASLYARHIELKKKDTYKGPKDAYL